MKKKRVQLPFGIINCGDSMTNDKEAHGEEEDADRGLTREIYFCGTTRCRCGIQRITFV